MTAPLSYSIAPNPLVEKTFDHMRRPLDDRNSVIYLQSFGGGGVAVGALLGPLGVAANMSMIGSNTDADLALLKGKIPLDPRALFSEVAADQPALAPAGAAGKSVRLTPLLEVVKQESDELWFGCSLLVDYTATGTNWVGKYVYQLSLRYPKADVVRGLSEEQLKALADQARNGFRALAQLYLDDAGGKLASEREVKFRSAFIWPRFNFELTGKDLPSGAERKNIRIPGTIYSLPRDLVQLAGEPASTPRPVASLASPTPAPTVKATFKANGLATPLPEDVKVIAPSSDVPAALAAYSGIWTGGWGAAGNRQHTLVVEQIDGRKAQLIYSLAAAPGARTVSPEARYLRVPGAFAEDGSLRAQLGNGAVVTYHLAADGRSLTGEFVSAVQRFDGLLQKRD